MATNLARTLSPCSFRGAGGFAGACQAEVPDALKLDTGFHLLYELKPELAREICRLAGPPLEDPMGSPAEAASYLFEECFRQGVLTSEFFLDNKRFLGKVAIQADPELRNGVFCRGPSGARTGAGSIGQRTG